jgi:hypothetical protein
MAVQHTTIHSIKKQKPPEGGFVFYLEVTGGFEPPVLRFCKPFPWTTRASHHKLKKGTPVSAVPFLLSIS